jgi:hypothetical protein
MERDNRELGVYDTVFVFKLQKLQGESFSLCREYYKDIDVDWFVNTWMKSKIRFDMDYSGIKWRNKAPYEVIESLVVEVGDYKKGSDRYLHEALWLGYMYSFFQWKTGVLSSELIDAIPVKWLSERYILHECGFDVAVSKIIEMSDYRNGIKTNYIEAGLKYGVFDESDRDRLILRQQKINEWIATDPYIQGKAQELNP